MNITNFTRLSTILRELSIVLNPMIHYTNPRASFGLIEKGPGLALRKRPLTAMLGPVFLGVAGFLM